MNMHTYAYKSLIWRSQPGSGPAICKHSIRGLASGSDRGIRAGKLVRMAGGLGICTSRYVQALVSETSKSKHCFKGVDK